MCLLLRILTDPHDTSNSHSAVNLKKRFYPALIFSHIVGKAENTSQNSFSWGAEHPMKINFAMCFLQFPDGERTCMLDRRTSLRQLLSEKCLYCACAVVWSGVDGETHQKNNFHGVPRTPWNINFAMCFLHFIDFDRKRGLDWSCVSFAADPDGTPTIQAILTRLLT